MLPATEIQKAMEPEQGGGLWLSRLTATDRLGSAIQNGALQTSSRAIGSWSLAHFQERNNHNNMACLVRHDECLALVLLQTVLFEPLSLQARDSVLL